MYRKCMCITLTFLLSMLYGTAQVVDSIPPKHFDMESDSILYELSLSEGAEDVYGIYDTITYEDYDGAIVDWFCEPRYEDGPEALMEYIQDNLRIPSGYEDSTGVVLVEFVVETDGTVSNPKVKVSLNPVLDAEAVRVVMSMPNKWIWNPSDCYNGIIERCFWQVPVKFNNP